jgi:hypothetical protein
MHSIVPSGNRSITADNGTYAIATFSITGGIAANSDAYAARTTRSVAVDATFNDNPSIRKLSAHQERTTQQ